MQFSDLLKNESILKALALCGYQYPTPIQEKSIPLILKGTDLIASAQTGTGKTAAFALPIIELLFPKQDSVKRGKKIRALVVSPTRELALQIEESLSKYGKYSNLRNAVIYGGTSIEPQKDMLNKGVDILVATPGRLLDLHKQDCINLDFVEILVIDEADLLLDMGFINDVKKIYKLCPKNKQTLLFSATIPDKVDELALEILENPKKVAISPSQKAAENVNQLLYFVSKAKKMELCLHLLRNKIKGDILIFRRTKFGVEKLHNMLTKNGYLADTIHGDKSQSAREEALQNFKDKKVSILIATDVASRGLDIDNLDAVINFDIPNVPETYVHRIGRTGRAGNTGVSYSFCAADEKNYIQAIEELIKEKITIETEHPYPLNPKAKPEVYIKKGSKHKKNRKSSGSKKNKKRWY